MPPRNPKHRKHDAPTVPPMVEEHDRESGISRAAARDRIAGDIAHRPKKKRPAWPTVMEEPSEPIKPPPHGNPE